MSLINWDQYDDNDVYSETHDIEVDYEIQDELEALNAPPETQETPTLSSQKDFNLYKQQSLHEHFKGGRTHIAQSRKGKYHQKRRAPRNLMIGMWKVQII